MWVNYKRVDVEIDDDDNTEIFHVFEMLIINPHVLTV